MEVFMEIKLENVNLTLDKNEVLKEINLSLEGGHIYGLIGRNGSGKSMLLKTICGFIPPTSGKVFVNQVDLYQTHTFPQNTRALLDKPEYINELTGYENLELLASILHKDYKKMILEALEKVNLSEEKNKKFGKYSLGMKQKLGIAQVIMEDPDIMIFDEPFNGLEEESANKIRELLKEYKSRGKLIIIATHIKEDIESLCDVIYRMDAGKIIQQ